MPHLILFFTDGFSLQNWQEMGILERELALYLKYLEKGWKVSFLTYGDHRDLSLKPLLKGVDVLCNQTGLPLPLYKKQLFSLFVERYFSLEKVFAKELESMTKLLSS